MTPAEALSALLESRDAEHDAPVWADGGRTITHLARVAGVRVTFAHCDLRELTTTYRTIDGRKECSE